MYPEGLDAAVREGAELGEGRVEVDEIDLVPGLGEGELGAAGEDEGDRGVRFDAVLLLGAQLEGQVDVLLPGP